MSRWDIMLLLYSSSILISFMFDNAPRNQPSAFFRCREILSSLNHFIEFSCSSCFCVIRKSGLGAFGTRGFDENFRNIVQRRGTVCSNAVPLGVYTSQTALPCKMRQNSPCLRQNIDFGNFLIYISCVANVWHNDGKLSSREVKV